MPVHRLMENTRGNDSALEALADLRGEAAQLQNTCICPRLFEGDGNNQEDNQMDVDITEPENLNILSRQFVPANNSTLSPPGSVDDQVEDHIPTMLELLLSKDREHLASCPCHPNSLPMAKFSRRVKESFIQMGALPLSLSTDEKQTEHRTQRGLSVVKQPSPSDPFAPARRPSTQTGHLYAGSQFQGKQQSNSHSYDVMVDIKHVDLNESILYGYLHIRGLTEEYPELTTYFEAEMIGPKHSFLTRRWDADDSVDEEHWTLFIPFERISRSVFTGLSGGVSEFNNDDEDDTGDSQESDCYSSYYDGCDEDDSEENEDDLQNDDCDHGAFSHGAPNTGNVHSPHHQQDDSHSHLHRRRRRRQNQHQHPQQRKRRRHHKYDPSCFDFRNEDVIFMRWKEHFLVPDHRVEGISGASFAGFYYICYSKSTGQISGYYYHQASEKFQKLSLSHVEQRSFPSFEFR